MSNDLPLALVADIGRTAVRLGLTNGEGRLARDTIRTYASSAQSSIAGTIRDYIAEAGHTSVPGRAAIAVSGVPRGESFSVTNSRWILSRSALASLLGSPPLILNDFAANAWAMSAPECSGKVEALGETLVRPYEPGAFCIIGVGSGLGVALLSRDEFGVVSVIPTEGGHMGFMAGLPGAAPVLETMFEMKGLSGAETLLSRPGLAALYQAIARVRGETPMCIPNLLDEAACRDDPIASETLSFFARALWHFAGNMVLAYGAWDGIVLTGSVVAALRPLLERADLTEAFLVNGPYRHMLCDVARSTVSFQYAELEGAAAALRQDTVRRLAAKPQLVAAA